MKKTRWAQQIHIVLDNLSAHKTKAVEEFLEQNPKVRFHFTPTYSSWLNQVELWFAKIQRDVITRGVFTSVADLATAEIHSRLRPGRETIPLDLYRSAAANPYLRNHRDSVLVGAPIPFREYEMRDFTSEKIKQLIADNVAQEKVVAALRKQLFDLEGTDPDVAA